MKRLTLLIIVFLSSFAVVMLVYAFWQGNSTIVNLCPSQEAIELYRPALMQLSNGTIESQNIRIDRENIGDLTEITRISLDNIFLAFDKHDNLLALDDTNLWSIDTLTGTTQIVSSLSYRMRHDRVDFNFDSTLIASRTYDREIGVWNSEAHEFVVYQQISIDLINPNGALLFMPLSNVLVYSGDNTIYFWDVLEHIRTNALTTTTGGIGEIAVSSDGALFAYSRYVPSSATTLIVCDLYKNQALLKVSLAETSIKSLVFSHDGNVVVAGDSGGTIYLWRLSDGILIHTFNHSTLEPINDITFSPDDEMMLVGYGSPTGSYVDDDVLVIWDIETGQMIRSLEGNSRAVNSVTFNNAGNLLVSNSADGRIVVWGIQGNIP